MVPPRKKEESAMKSRNRSLTERLILSSLLVFALVLLLCMGIFSYLLTSLISYSASVEEEKVSAWRLRMDENLLSIQRYVSSLDSNTDLKLRTEPYERLPSAVYDIQEHIMNYTGTSHLLSQLFIWYPGADLIIGSIGAFRASSYYALMNHLSKDGEERYFSSLCVSAPGYYLYEDLSGSLRYSFIYPIYYQRQRAGYIVAEIDPSAFLPEEEACQVYVGDRLIATTLEEGEEQGASFRSSSTVAHDLVYITLAPDRLRPVTLPLVITILGVLASILITYFGSSEVIRRNSRPVEDILTSLGLPPAADPSRAIAKIEELKAAIEDDDLMLSLQQRKLSSAFLQYVLINRLSSSGVIDELATFYGTKIGEDGFTMIVITSKRDSNDAVASRIEGKFANTIVTMVQDRIVILFCHDGSADISDFISFTSGSDWRTGIGLAYISPSYITVSFSEALLALECCGSGEYRLYSHDDFDLVPSEDLDIGRMFTAEIEMGRFAEALRYLDKLFETIFDHTEDPILRKVKLKAVTDQLQAIGDTGTISYESEAITKECIRDILLKLLDERGEESIHVEGGGSAVEKAMRIIRVKFQDPMFSLSALSDLVGCSNTYLSTQFKARYGINVSKFIQNLRMEKAKQLLLTTDLRVKDIALAVGFSSDIAFLRAFRKSEHTTPGALRKAVEEGDSDIRDRDGDEI